MKGRDNKNTEEIEEDIVEEDEYDNSDADDTEDEPEDDDYEELTDYVDESDDESYEDLEDEDDFDDDDKSSGKSKKLMVVVIVAAVAVLIGGALSYMKIVSDKQERAASEQQTAETQENNPVEDQEAESEDEEVIDDDTDEEVIDKDEAEDNDEAEEIQDDSLEEEPSAVPTATPKPLPTATPMPTYDNPDEPGAAMIGGEDYYENLEAENGALTAEAETVSKVVFIGDSRFRTMANVASANDYGWECSKDGNLSWLAGTAYPHVEHAIGEGTQVFINVGINDLTESAGYATSINAKAAEWKEKGANVYFVAVGPVDAESDISNQDICDFNTYMFNNLNIPFIDVYNYLVKNGFYTEDNVTYTAATSNVLYNYLCSFIQS